MAVEGPPQVFWRWFPVGEFISRASYAGDGDPGRWSSFWRTVGHNRAVGGDRWSQHLVGLAADHSPASSAFRDRARRAGLIAVEYPTHDHIQAWEKGTLERLLS